MKRFLDKVDRTRECWLWTAKKNNKGYGMFRVGRDFKLAHRIAFELVHGPVPAKVLVLHKCDNPSCVNPKHLFLGNHAANVRDMHAKGRGWGGIGPSTAFAILWERRSGVSRKQIMTTYGVTEHVVKDIAQRRSWQSLSTTAHD